MTSFPLGKLDAICARLKSSQRSLSAARFSNLENVEQEANIALSELEKSNQATKKDCDTDVSLKSNTADINANGNPLCIHFLERQSSEHANRIGDIFEKVEVQSSSIDNITEAQVEEDFITNKHNNNNILDATDYNNKVASSAQTTTLQSTDSVSSTIVEPCLSNENFHSSQPTNIPVLLNIIPVSKYIIPNPSYTIPVSSITIPEPSNTILIPQTSNTIPVPKNTTIIPPLLNTVSKPSSTIPEPLNTIPSLSNAIPEPSNTIPEPSNAIPEPSNTISVPSNTISVPLNIVQVPSNTIPVPPNTILVPPNTLSVPPNTIPVPPNTIPISPNTIPISLNTNPVLLSLTLPHSSSISLVQPETDKSMILCASPQASSQLNSMVAQSTCSVEYTKKFVLPTPPNVMHNDIKDNDEKASLEYLIPTVALTHREPFASIDVILEAQSVHKDIASYALQTPLEAKQVYKDISYNLLLPSCGAQDKDIIPDPLQPSCRAQLVQKHTTSEAVRYPCDTQPAHKDITSDPLQSLHETHPALKDITSDPLQSLHETQPALKDITSDPLQSLHETQPALKDITSDPLQSLHETQPALKDITSDPLQSLHETQPALKDITSDPLQSLHETQPALKNITSDPLQSLHETQPALKNITSDPLQSLHETQPPLKDITSDPLQSLHETQPALKDITSDPLQSLHETPPAHKDTTSDPLQLPSTSTTTLPFPGTLPGADSVFSSPHIAADLKLDGGNKSLSYETTYMKPPKDDKIMSVTEQMTNKSEHRVSNENFNSTQDIDPALPTEDSKHVYNISLPSFDNSSTPAVIASDVLPMMRNERQECSANKQSSQYSISSTFSRSSGRRKSRKPANPQKQVTNRMYTSFIPRQESSLRSPSILKRSVQNGDIDIDSLYLQERTIKIMKLSGSKLIENCEKSNVQERFLVPPQPSAPLDLSLRHTSSQSKELYLSSISAEKAPSFGNLNSSCLDLPDTETGGDIRYRKLPDRAEKVDKQIKFSDNIIPSANNDASKTVESKVLEDFANSTMKELLGIYGFDGPDSKSINLNSLQNFLAERRDNYPNGGDEDNATMTSLENAERRERNEPISPTTLKRKSDKGRRPGIKSWSTRPSPEHGQENPPHTIAAPQIKVPTNDLKQKGFSSPDFTSFDKYIKRYDNGTDCGQKVCKDLGYKDHHHCLDCPQKVFIRKEEMVRHYKWHKKRNDSLQYGFMRYSPMDDCKKYGNCIHNSRQTHYHCLQKDCGKVYVSTSDVQMHANFHRKDSAIIQEGFQRFRATEDCGTSSCSFYGLRTTHFHCRRPQCNFTFKNKADIEKHKSYHLKDEILGRDGFKKFMKYEACTFAGCQYSKISNHIHCIRPGCLFVLHSTSQLYSHKHKHERREFEHAYRNIRHMQQQTSRNGSMGNKAETINRLKSVSATLMTLNHTKAPSPSVSSFNSAKIKPENCVKTSDVGSLEALPVPVTSPLPLKLASHLTVKAVPGFAEVDPTRCHKKAPKSAALNLTSQVSVIGDVSGTLRQNEKEEIKNESEESRQTLTLPIKLLSENYNSSLVDETYKEKHAGAKKNMNIKCEDEGLFMFVKKEQISAYFKEGNLKEGVRLKPELYSKSIQQFDTFDDNDDSDDDDDDDKDYGQLEEPTLVNLFGNSIEEDKPNSLFGFPLLKDDSEDIRKTNLKKEINPYVNVEEECKSQEIKTGSVKNLCNISNDDVKIQQNQVNNTAHLLQPQLSRQKAKETSLILKDIEAQSPERVVPKKRERDELWKKYLIRYTANDACFSRCACLYKDHYHCRLKGCQVVFKSIEGVRKHAKFHELQDNITPLAFLQYDSSVSCCSTDCQFNSKEAHYHCKWAKCSHVIPASGPTFSRLEHHKSHENATMSVGKSCNSMPTSGLGPELEVPQKRRGRPPKYPILDTPFVPKVHLTEKEILDSTLASLHNKLSENGNVINGFKKFTSTEMCPDDLCVYTRQDHFHCGRKYCHTSTDKMDFLNLHAQDFHNNITVLVGYEFFERMVDCRRPDCQNNKLSRHFHCIRPRCDYSFVRHSTMIHHNRKHPTVTSTVLSAAVTRPISAASKNIPTHFVPIAPAVTPSPTRLPSSAATTSTTTASSPNYSKTIKASGTFFPLSGASCLNLSSLSSSSITGSHVIALGGLTPFQSRTPLTLASSTLAQVVSVSQVLNSPVGMPIFSSATLLTLPQSIVTTSIPVVPQTARGQHTSLLPAMIPLSQHRLAATPLVGIAAGQLIAASQSGILQPNRSLLGVDLLQLFKNKTSITTTPTTVSTLTTTTTPASGLPQQPLHQQQHVSISPLNWANLKKQMQYSVVRNCGRPFCKLKKKDHFHCLDCNQAFSDPARLRVHIGKHGFQFKKSEHRANQGGISAQLKEKSSISKHIDLSKETVTKEKMVESHDGSLNKEALILQPLTFTSILKQADIVGTNNTSIAYLNGNINGIVNKLLIKKLTKRLKVSNKIPLSGNDHRDTGDLGTSLISKNCDSNHDRNVDLSSSVVCNNLKDINESLMNPTSSSLTLSSCLSRKSGRKRMKTKNIDYVRTDTIDIPTFAKQRKMQPRAVSTNMSDIPASYKQRKTHSRAKSETTIPEGYKRFGCSEDCEYVRCAYRQTVSHYHCLRLDCGYGFSDKSRIIQHHVRHERLDALMDGEFQQFRASITCEQDDCEFNEKASHFHCLKCSYSCADSSKVPAHRKHHIKLDSITNQGFIKYGGTAECQTSSCSFFHKQTHYHCTFSGCNHTVLGPSQMAPHKLKHTHDQFSSSLI